MYGSGASGPSYGHHNTYGYQQQQQPFGGGGVNGAGPATPLQWPAVASKTHPNHQPRSPTKLARTARDQLRRWWDAALSGGGAGRRRHAPPPPHSAGQSASGGGNGNDWVARLCFFAIAVAYKTPWTAVSSLLGQLSALHGPRVLLGLNLAYFLPSIPVLLAAAAGGGGGNGGSSGSGGGGGGGNSNSSSSSSSFESRAGVPTAAALRLFLGLGGLACVSLLLPLLCASPGHSPALLLAATAALGALYGVAFGASYGLAARRCAPPGATVALSTGFVACGGVVLAADVAIKRGAPDYSPGGLAALFRTVAGTCLAGALASAVLLRRHWDELEADGGGLVAELQQQQQFGSGGRVSSSPSSSSLPLPLPLFLRRLLSFSSSPAAARAAVRMALFLPPRGGAAARGRPHVIGVPFGGGQGGGGHGGGGGGNGFGSGGFSSGPAFGGGGGAGMVGSPSHGVRHRAMGAESMALMSSADGTSKRFRSSSGGGGGGGSSSADAAALPVVAAYAPGGGKGGGGANGSRDPDEWAATLATARRIAPAALALSLSVGTSMLAFPFFTYAPAPAPRPLPTGGDGSGVGGVIGGGGGAVGQDIYAAAPAPAIFSSSLGRSLPQALFYARLAGDVGGRVLTPYLGIAGTRSLALWSLAKAVLLLPLLAALLRPSRCPGGDWGLCAAVALYWALSGAVNTAAYVVAPRLVAAPRRAQAGGLMAAAFQAACFGGLAGAAVLQWAIPPAAMQAVGTAPSNVAADLGGGGHDAGARMVEAAAAAVRA